MNKKIAFLAPEIPALSATFVYNEILLLQKKGYSVVPISVHVPAVPAREDRLQELTRQTCYLYKQGLLGFFLANLQVFFASPGKYLFGLQTAIRDAVQVGLLSRTGVGLLFRFIAAAKVACILENKKCTHLHVHFAHVPADIGMYALLLSGIPFSFTAHANDLFERGWLLQEKIARSKFTATISRFNREYMIGRGGDPEKIHIVRCGVESARFVSVSAKETVPPYRIGTIGRMVEKKGFDTLLYAASLLRQRGVDFQLVMAGGGPLEEDMHALAAQLGLNDVVDFLGPVANEKVPGWLKILDLFVLPCQKDSNGDMDGIPVVLMEAMLCGIPVISTRISGIPELIEHEKEGLLVEPRSPEALARAMRRLLEDETLRRQMRQNAQQKVKKEFDAEVNVQRLVGFLEGE